jgi:hypothetical protein
MNSENKGGIYEGTERRERNGKERNYGEERKSGTLKLNRLKSRDATAFWQN